MDKNAIKKFAIWARRELIERVSQRAAMYGITAVDHGDPAAESVNGRLLTASEKSQRKTLISSINGKGFEQVIEEVAYTWFNRFAALRFMEVNGYLPSHIRVFTNDAGEFKPQILTEAIHLDLPGLNMDKVYELENASKTEELFKYLLVVQCNALNSILPGMFQRIDDYTELLLPDNLLREGSVIEKLISSIPEDNFNVTTENGQIEIIGWLYQYYISEKHDKVVDPLHGKVIKKEEVPAATQLFTTDWVVRYLIDNSVGRFWVERTPNSHLAEQLTYFVKPKNGELNTVDEKITPQDVTVLDPCVGSGHFLIYAFDVLMKIYVEYGYSERDAAVEIIKSNIFGLDIDGRATQLAYFSVMMKARQYDRRFFTKGIQPHIYEIQESNYIDSAAVEVFCENDAELRKDTQLLIQTLIDAKEYGSIIRVPSINFAKINDRLMNIENALYDNYFNGYFKSLIKTAEVLSNKYAVVATNPPYLNKFDSKLKSFIVNNYADYKGDLFSVFMYQNFRYCKKDGFTGFMTPMVWMFIQTYEKLRKFIIDKKEIVTLIQMEYSAYEEATVPICSFVLRNGKMNLKALCFKLSDFRGGMAIQNQKVLEALCDPCCGYFFESEQDNFSKIPGSPVAYWASDAVFASFEKEKISKYYIVRNGISTGDNNRYLRLWHELDYSSDDWKPCNKGGAYRKWYGNNEYFVYWKNNGKSIRTSLDEKGRIKARLGGIEYSFKEGIEMSRIGNGTIGFRYSFSGFVYESSTNDIYQCYDSSDLYSVLGYFNSVVASYFLNFMNPTINVMPEDLRGLPYIPVNNNKIIEIVKDNINLSKYDWDSFETSWEFISHPLVVTAWEHDYSYLSDCWNQWEQSCNKRFEHLKVNEEMLNSIFIDVYSLSKELSPVVYDKDVTVRKADLQRDIKSFISYAVGCMFGRYSLDILGLVYAGGTWAPSNKYTTFPADDDAILPICDDEYFEDDIVSLFVTFVEKVYGEETLEDNLQFIADALGGKGSSREIIRNYFMNGFYADHVKVYQKRPIYWLFDSGKKNGFKCLIYLHRYKPDTIARIRTDYIHEQQSRYRTAIEDLNRRVADASPSEKVKLNKQLAKVMDQAEELRIYEEKIHHLADQMIAIDLDDGVKVNYAKFQDVLAKIK
ncbi:BREX-1 system adenine-specific DNA-methyltransferase PglX [Succinimonas amylolytica]|uniref:BREX-1 system adenine-specific DNA-methyltransferase PglX n=1 Tax=Succinimonas amylolytica TaxID=83769 RepID=UPI0023A89A2A